MIILKSIHLSIPDFKPFDRNDWFEAFVGNVVIDILKTGLIDSYWFSRYQDPKKHIRLRIKTKDYAVVKPHIDALISKFGLIDIADEETYGGEEFRRRRFLGENTRNIDPFDRQQLIWDFLYASSRIYVDTFSHSDADGYWYREENHDRDNNIDGDTMESLHHLFCNLTAVQPRVDLLVGIAQQGTIQSELVASHYRRWNRIPDQYVRASSRVEF